MLACKGTGAAYTRIYVSSYRFMCVLIPLYCSYTSNEPPGDDAEIADVSIRHHTSDMCARMPRSLTSAACWRHTVCVFVCVCVCVRIPFIYVCALIPLYLCPHTSVYVSSHLYMCPHTFICVLILVCIWSSARWRWHAKRTLLAPRYS